MARGHKAHRRPVVGHRSFGSTLRKSLIGASYNGWKPEGPDMIVRAMVAAALAAIASVSPAAQSGAGPELMMRDGPYVRVAPDGDSVAISTGPQGARAQRRVTNARVKVAAVGAVPAFRAPLRPAPSP